jgi:4-diphosphocytidyl-2-C-methyl-D-erythritol kinase
VSDREELVAPAKLTVSLAVVGRRPDGYHELEAEMVSVDLHDSLVVEPGSFRLEVVADPSSRAGALPEGEDNIVCRALGAVGRRAGVLLVKRIPVGGGLGGGSTDAAAILRWAGCTDPAVAASLGSDVPFCLHGGRAVVRGVGERVSPLPYEARTFVLLVPPFSMDTAAVYRRWDDLARGVAGQGAERAPGGSGARNSLTGAALAEEPRLREWGDLLGDLVGVEPTLAGSGSTWWVEGTADALGLTVDRPVRLGRHEGRLVPVRTVPAGWAGPDSKGR